MDDIPDMDQVPRKARAWYEWLANKIVGVDEELLAQCPQRDRENVLAIAEIMICTWVYQSLVFALIAHQLFGSPGYFRPDFVIVAAALAAFILLIDAYMVMRSSWHLAGEQQLLRFGGLDITGGPMERVKAGFLVMVRIALALGTAQLTAILFSLFLFRADVEAPIQKAWLEANSGLIGQAAALVDGAIRRATEAVTTQTARVNGLAAQVAAVRQNQIDPSANDQRQGQDEISQLLAQKAKADDEMRTRQIFATNESAGIKGTEGNTGRAGNGPRYRAAAQQLADAKAHAQDLARELDAARQRLDARAKQLPSANEAIRQRSQDHLPDFERALAAENAKLASLKDELATLIANRENAIRHAIENAPGHVNMNGGFLARLRVLERIAENDSKIAAIILLIDLISFGLEAAGVLAKVTSQVPSTYAALLAGDGHVRTARIADKVSAELNAIGGPDNDPTDPPPRNGDGAGATSQPDVFGDVTEPGSTPPKRGRGRPRKNALNGASELPPGEDEEDGQEAA